MQQELEKTVVLEETCCDTLYHEPGHLWSETLHSCSLGHAHSHQHASQVLNILSKREMLI